MESNHLKKKAFYPNKMKSGNLLQLYSCCINGLLLAQKSYHLLIWTSAQISQLWHSRCGKKVVAGLCGVVSAGIIALLPVLGSGAAAVVAMVTAALSFTALCGASLSSINVDLFPTSLRWRYNFNINRFS